MSAWELNKIVGNQYANYTCIHMGSELNNALKFLINSRIPEDLSYEEMKMVSRILIEPETRARRALNSFILHSQTKKQVSPVLFYDYDKM